MDNSPTKSSIKSSPSKTPIKNKGKYNQQEEAKIQNQLKLNTNIWLSKSSHKQNRPKS